MISIQNLMDVVWYTNGVLMKPALNVWNCLIQSSVHSRTLVLSSAQSAAFSIPMAISWNSGLRGTPTITGSCCKIGVCSLAVF